MNVIGRVLRRALSTLFRGSWGGCAALILILCAVCTLLRSDGLPELSALVGALVVLASLVVILRLITGLGRR